MIKPSNARTALTQLCTPIQTMNLPISRITDIWLNNLNNAITEITQYSIEKSKTIVGQQDMSLIGAATAVRDVTSEIITMYKHIRDNMFILVLPDNSLNRSQLQKSITELRYHLIVASQNINRSYLTPSKKEAQQALRDTITILITPILEYIEKQLNV